MFCGEPYCQDFLASSNLSMFCTHIKSQSRPSSSKSNMRFIMRRLKKISKRRSSSNTTDFSRPLSTTCQSNRMMLNSFSEDSTYLTETFSSWLSQQGNHLNHSAAFPPLLISNFSSINGLGPPRSDTKGLLQTLSVKKFRFRRRAFSVTILPHPFGLLKRP